MLIDLHTHICALGRGGITSDPLLYDARFRFMRWRLKIRRSLDTWQSQLEHRYAQLLDTSGLDAAVVLALDAVYDQDGNRDDANTHLFVENDYIAGLAKDNPRILFGASVHPYRRDAVKELERCIAAGAVLMKWLPLAQRFDPADQRCIALYEVLAHHKMPLLSHTGGEQMLVELDPSVRDPARLEVALKCGVTVIAAHCGTRSTFREPDYLPTFCRMAREHERFYGDTAALLLPTRKYAFPKLLEDDSVRSKLVHGSDWPIIPIPPITLLGVRRTLRAWHERNWMKRDVELKRALRFDDAYLHRAQTLLRLPGNGAPAN